MRTRGDDRFLLLGFIFSEGIISSIDDVEEIEIVDDDAFIKLRASSLFSPETHCRGTTVTSSCGICGRPTMEGMLENPVIELDEGLTIGLDAIENCLRSLTSEQNIFAKTGGSHACASISGKGTIERIFEDVGRHNAFDKLIGSYVDSGKLPLSRLASLVSGRASYELVQKAIRAGFPIMIAIGAPSSLAVDLSREYGLTLGCFAKDDSLSLYSGVRRIRKGLE
jgi:FdhD protein